MVYGLKPGLCRPKSGRSTPKIGLRSLAGVRREKLRELIGFTIPLLRVGRRFTLDGDVRPSLRVFGIHFKPLLETAFGVGTNGVRGTFRLAHTAIDALVG